MGRLFSVDGLDEVQGCGCMNNAREINIWPIFFVSSPM
ncbi:hypothetical protein WCP94_003388 [Bilophila wadsworthia]